MRDPQHINNTVHDLRLNENKLKAIFFLSLSRFTNLTDLNSPRKISYIEDGAFAGQANLQVLQLGYNKLTNLTEGMLRGLGRIQCSSAAQSSRHLTMATTYDRLQCETPRELFGYPLLSPVRGPGRSALNILASMCRDGVFISGYYCLRRRRRQEEKEKSICVKKTILEMRYGPEVAAAAANDPTAVQKLHDQVHHHTHHGKFTMSSSSSGMLGHSSGNTSSSRLSTIPQVEKLATAFSEARATKGNYIDVRSSVDERGRDVRQAVRAEDLMEEDRSDLEDESDSDDGRGSASEISTIAMEVDKVNQIINNCIDALKLDSVSTVATSSGNPTSPPPGSVSSISRGLIPLSPSINETCKVLPSPKIPPPPPLPLTTSLSERPGITGGGFISPPYRPPPPATAVRPIQRQMSADAAVIVSASKKHCGPAGGKARVYSLDVPEPRSPDSCQYPEKGSPLRCGEPLDRLPLVVGSGVGCNMDGVTMDGVSLQQHLEVQPDYHCAEHRHSVPALYFEGSHDSPAQRASFLKPLSRAKRDASSYSQLSPHQQNYSGYSSSPEYSSENTLRIWERFRPYRKAPREESCYITAGNALRKKVQFAKGEDLHDILDYWKGVSAQQKL
ncbi:Protein phosphatase 1 regulatory subunit 29 [Bagarius yarrelli]|uniref:Protein phosphatase 1 regulatory subunit 29 n=1 Tax=Bagarius yarrelli TaxID=175774 RepID=A0A556VUW5_BAGYA|nr:Protein phosphatase 1 regulatory subunit 29 [Bagarius yarrelli]